MPWTMTSDEHAGIVAIEATGTLLVADVARPMHAIRESPVYRQHLRVLRNLRSCRLGLSADDVRQIARV